MLPRAFMKKIVFSGWQTQLARSFALFFGSFALANLASEIWLDRADANLWWIDLRFLPTAISRAALLVSGTLLLFFGIRVPQAGWRRAATGLSAALVALVALFNAAQFYLLLGKGLITSGLPFAF